MSEYTWNELNAEDIRVEMDGHIYTPLSGPEQENDRWWAPGIDETGEPWDLYFEWALFGKDGERDRYRLVSVSPASTEHYRKRKAIQHFCLAVRYQYPSILSMTYDPSREAVYIKRLSGSLWVDAIGKDIGGMLAAVLKEIA
jgi:hypothetical protein